MRRERLNEGDGSGFSRNCGMRTLVDNEDGTGAAVEISNVTPKLTLNGQYRLWVTLAKATSTLFPPDLRQRRPEHGLERSRERACKRTTGQTSSTAA